MLVDGGEPAAGNANPERVVHEGQGGGAPRMIEGYHVQQRVVQTIEPLRAMFHFPVLIESMVRIRH